MNERASTPNFQFPAPQCPDLIGSWELGVGSWEFAGPYVLTNRPRETWAAIASTSAGIVETVGCTVTGMPS